MPQTRQLAAIMFTDIVGYTALMGNDEKKAFDLLTLNRSIQKPIIEQYNGRWIKEMGDGVMASFNTASDAVNAAMKIQDACNDANKNLDPHNATIYIRYSATLADVGRYEEALPLADKAVDLDPVSISSLHNLGWTNLVASNYQKSADAFQKALDLHPT